MKKAVIYTSLTGGYDNLPQYEVIDADFDYICFTNDYPAGSKVGQWEIRPIPIDIDDKIRLSRYVKLMPHAVFPDYEYSVWLDANLVITEQNIYDIIKSHITANHLWCAIKHPRLDCIYDDARMCIKGAKASYKEIIPQIKFLQKEKFPQHYGLYENNFIIRAHNNTIIRTIDNQWWELYLRFSRRDQMSLCYIFWKKSFKPAFLLPENRNTHNVDGIRFIPHKQITLQKRIIRKFHCWYNQIRLAASTTL